MELNTVEQAELALRCYDKGALTKKQVSKVIGINFDTGDFTEYWSCHLYNSRKTHLLMQMHDRHLITKEVLIEQLFNI